MKILKATLFSDFELENELLGCWNQHSKTCSPYGKCVEHNDSQYRIMIILGDDNNNNQIRIIGDIANMELVKL